MSKNSVRVSIPKLIQNLESITPMEDSEAQQTNLTFPVYALVLGEDGIDYDQLERFTVHQLEYALDAVMYCPTMDQDNLEDAEGHPLHEYLKGFSMISDLSELKGVKKKVTFF